MKQFFPGSLFLRSLFSKQAMASFARVCQVNRLTLYLVVALRGMGDFSVLLYVERYNKLKAIAGNLEQFKS